MFFWSPILFQWLTCDASGGVSGGNALLVMLVFKEAA
jgi:hypothetical protein